MKEINPTEAAQLADEVYAVQTASEVKRFLDRPLFKKAEKSNFSPHKHLKAEVGGRVILNHTDGFGVCAQGKDDNDLFLIFRGTTTKNNGADIFLFCFLVAGIMRAHPRFHRYRPMAEYMAGFIITFLSWVGFYYLWW